MIAEGFRGEHIVQDGCSVMSLTYSEAHGHCLQRAHPVHLASKQCCQLPVDVGGLLLLCGLKLSCLQNE